MALKLGKPGVDDLLPGTNKADRMFGYSGDDKILALDGDDTIFGGEGWDTIEAGKGNDIIWGEDFRLLHLGERFLGFLSTENIFGGAGNDIILGRGMGEAGNDTLVAGSDGGSGDDLMFNAGGDASSIFTFSADVFKRALVAGAGKDTVIITDAIDPENFSIGSTVALGTKDGKDDNQADKIVVDGINDGTVEIVGFDSKDTLYLENIEGIDTKTDLTIRTKVTGTAGHYNIKIAYTSSDYINIYDVATKKPLIVINGYDTESAVDALNVKLLKAAGKPVTVLDGNPNSLNAGNGDDNIYAGKGADTIKGGGGSDAIFGQIGNDKLYGELGDDALDGGAGNDTLYASIGADTLTGGGGKDRFVFDATVGTDKTITDFRVGVDRIDLSKIDANGADVGNGAFISFMDGTPYGSAFLGQHGELITRVGVRDGHTGLVLSGDVNGDKIADFSIFLAGISDLQFIDIIA